MFQKICVWFSFVWTDCYMSVLNLRLTHLNTQLNPICHLLALLGGRHILHVSRIRVNTRH